MFEHERNSLGSKTLNLQEFERGGRIFQQQSLAPLTRSTLENFSQHKRQSFADSGNFGNFALGIFQDVGDAFGETLDSGGPIAVAANAEGVLTRDFHEVGGFEEAAGNVFVLHER